MNKLKKDQNFTDKILKEGTHKASEIASKKIKDIKNIIGF